MCVCMGGGEPRIEGIDRCGKHKSGNGVHTEKVQLACEVGAIDFYCEERCSLPVKKEEGKE